MRRFNHHAKGRHMDNSTAVLLGIGSSLIATAIFVSISWYIRTVALPWYADKIYKGVRLDGRWSLVSAGTLTTANWDVVFELNQKGDRVSGTITLGAPGRVYTTFTVDGRIRDSVFSATAWPVSLHEIDAMIFLLRVYSKGDTLHLEGQLAGLLGEEGKIEVLPGPVTFDRTSTGH